MLFFLNNVLEIPENPWTASSQKYRKAWSTVWNGAKNLWSEKGICRENPQRHPQILSETLIEWPLLLDNINVEYCNTVSVSSCTLCKSFAWKSDHHIIWERLECYDCEMQLNSFKVREYLFLCRPDRNCHINLKVSCWSQDFFQLAVENVCALFLIMWPRFN